MEEMGKTPEEKPDEELILALPKFQILFKFGKKRKAIK